MDYIFVSAFSNILLPNNRVEVMMNQLKGDSITIAGDFNHPAKDYYPEEQRHDQRQLLLHVPSYKKNLSIKRIWSHLMFAKHLKGYLNSLDDKPHAIYCAMPTSSSAFVCAKYCKRHKIKFVVDVIDLWPDSLLPLIKGKSIIKQLLFPWTYLTRYAYRSADVILGESVLYANEAKNYNAKAPVYPIYLGVDMNIIEKVKQNNQIQLTKPNDEVWIAYAGSLGVSYDFNALFDAIKTIHGKYKYKLWFIGDGVRRTEIDSYIIKDNLNAEITGYLPYERLLGYLYYCDIAINIFRKDTKVVYSYKFNDYVAMNCFVLNSLEGETAGMVDEYRIGRNFDFEGNSMSSVLEDTLANWNRYSEWKGNTQRLIEEKLDKNKIYSVVPEIFQSR